MANRCSSSYTCHANEDKHIKNQNDPNFGFNAATEKYEDLVQAGVIDPTKVTRSALQNAASIASLMLTTEAMVSTFVEEEGN